MTDKPRKPEKKQIPEEDITNDVPPQVAFQWGYNKACDEWEAYHNQQIKELEELVQEYKDAEERMENERR